MDTRKRQTYTADISITLLKPPLSARGVLSTAEMSACAHSTPSGRQVSDRAVSSLILENLTCE